MNAMRQCRSMSSRRQLVLEAIRRHFRAVGAAPSYREIADTTGIGRRHVRPWLDQLQRDGLLTFIAGQPRSITLTDRMANLSDTELQLACASRGWTVVKPDVHVAALAAAYPVDPRVTDYGLPLLEALRHIE